MRNHQNRLFSNELLVMIVFFFYSAIFTLVYLYKFNYSLNTCISVQIRLFFKHLHLLDMHFHLHLQMLNLVQIILLMIHVLFMLVKRSLETDLNTDLKVTCEWLKANRLSLNIKKSQLIIFHSKSKKVDFTSFSIKLEGSKLKP